MKKEPPFLKRLWICVTNWKRWRQRVAIGHAGSVMWNSGIAPELAVKLISLANKMWEEEYERFTLHSELETDQQKGQG